MENVATITSTVANPNPWAAMPSGVTGWSDVGALAVWFLLMAMVGMLLGKLRERTSPHSREAAGRRGLKHRISPSHA